jgi:hypothetical protein
MCGKYQNGRQNVKTPNSGKRTRGGGRGGGRGWGEWVTGTDRDTSRDEHWHVLFCMLVNGTPINK